MTDIIALPEMNSQLRGRLWGAYNQTHDYKHPSYRIHPMEVVINAYLSEAVRWQPIDPHDIKPGMRVRMTEPVAGATRMVIGTVSEVKGEWMDVGDLACSADTDEGRRWEVDPRTIPADPDQAILDLLAEWIMVPAEATDLLSDLRAVADVTPKAVSSDE